MRTRARVRVCVWTPFKSLYKSPVNGAFYVFQLEFVTDFILC